MLLVGRWEAKLGMSIFGMVKLDWMGAVIATTGTGATGTVMLGSCGALDEDAFGG